MNDATLPAQQSLLFADLVGSTRMYETLGDSEALRVVSLAMGKLEALVRVQKGRVVKTIGDEVMAAFADPTAAAQAATNMMREMEHGLPGVSIPLQLRIGFHHGPVLEAEGDVFGDTVNTAARLVKLAKPGQIMTSSAAVEHFSLLFKQASRNLERFTLKGKSEEFAVYELIWDEPEDATILAGKDNMAALLAALAAGAQLKLHPPQGGSFTLNAARPGACFGRAADSDVAMDDPRVSRRHAKIELRRDKFVLVDESSNGTYVRFEGQDEILLRREEVVLQGRGCIGFGNSTQADTPHTQVRFELA
jgi:class 3 adenylate cyclase